MKSIAAKSPNRRAGRQAAGRRWNLMRRSVLWAGLLAALCALPALTAFASFSDFLEYPWQGGVNNFYGNTLITSSGTFTNSKALIYDASTLPPDTGPLFGWDLTPGVTRSGNYYYGLGVLVDVSGGTDTISNSSGGTMQAIVTGSGQAFGIGLYAEANNVTINNSGTMDGEVQNNDGTAAGIYATGNVTITNNAGGTLSATAPYYAGGIYTSGGGAQMIINNGTIIATATGAMQGSNANQAYCAGIDMFSYDPSDMSPIYVVNNGSITVTATGGATNIAHCGAIWNDQNDVTWINNGTMTATMTGSSGDASGIYFGANNANVTFINTGTINNGGGTSNGGEGVWMENDGTSGNMYFYNSGTIASGEPFALSIAAYSTGPWGTAYVTNTGTISGGWLGLGWPGNLNFYDSGDILTALSWLGTGNGNDNVYISGLPTIQPVMSASSGGSNTLVFNLTGTLQSVNGSAASGASLSAFNLGSSGNIVVSGKTYSWSNFTNVSGTITAATAPLAGPTNLTATVTSITQANLTWNSLTNATNYNVKRSLASDGPYTTIASGVATTHYTDNAAYISLEYYYVVSAMVAGSETANSAEVALRHPKLTGAIIGTAGSWDNDGNTITNVFDNNLNTFFDGPTANGCWVGLYFGANVSNAITQINYCPRSGSESRMVNGIFQGANQANFSDAVTLYKVTAQPAAGQFTAATITNTSAFRYVRYLSPNGGYCNVAELQFHGNLAGAPVPRPSAPGLAATAASSNQINLAWNAVTNAASYILERSTTDGGPYVIIATGWTMTNYTDIGLAGATTYYYVVTGVNAGGQSTNNVQASATTLLSAGLTATAASATQIDLTWNAISNATSYNVGRSAVSGGPYSIIATGVTATNYTDNVPAGMKYYYVINAICGGLETPNSPEATIALPYPWASLDVGAVGLVGSATYSNGVFSVTGTGADIWNAADAFRFVYAPVTGNCTIVARVTAVEDIDPWSKAGVMIRENLATNAANALIAVTPGNGITFQNRPGAGSNSYNNNTTGLSAPYWVKLVRSGNTFTTSYSPNGATWTQLGTATFTIASTVYVGLALTSHNNSSLCAATFADVTAPGWPTSIPPASPARLSATPLDSQVALSWSAASGAISYNVKRGTLNDGPYTIVTNITTTNYTDIGLANGTNYYYVVSALNTAGESANSAQVSATPVNLPQPCIVGASISGGNLVFSGTNGLAGGAYTIWSSTNIATPLTNWIQVGSGDFDGNGNFSSTNAINTGETQQFYLLRQP
jgi:fibronectin type 3 domain-containing protein/regulation of enolase protein 1 (concanavalin A-like superfamily)